ncbi:hypothetical protein M1432_01915 [Patescibacteria group bacterium]|nr:hypothetical protein [Patescibacteria group bacterium]
MGKRDRGMGLFVPSLFAAVFLLSPFGGLFTLDLTALAADTNLGGHLNASNYGIYNISGLGIGTDNVTPGAVCFSSGCQTVPYGGGTQQSNAAYITQGAFGSAAPGSNNQYLFKPATNNTATLAVQNSGGSYIFDVDTANGRVGILTGGPAYALDVNGTIQANATFRTPSVAWNETNRRAKDSGNVDIEAVYGWQGNSSGKTFLQIWGFAPPTMYRTTGDLPAPYGIGFGNGSESGGIMPIGQGDNLQEIMFYGSNSGPTTFTWKHQVWESSTYDPSNSNYYSAPAMSLNANTGQPRPEIGHKRRRHGQVLCELDGRCSILCQCPSSFRFQ